MSVGNAGEVGVLLAIWAPAYDGAALSSRRTSITATTRVDLAIFYIVSTSPSGPTSQEST